MSLGAIEAVIFEQAATLAERLRAELDEARDEGRTEGASAERRRLTERGEDTLALVRVSLAAGNDEAVVEAVRAAVEVAEAARTDLEATASDRERLRERNAVLGRQVEALQAVVRWALGESGEFRPREPGDGPLWWRTELAARFRAAGGSHGA